METEPQAQRTGPRLPEGRTAGGLAGKGEESRRHRLVVTEQSRGCRFSLGNVVSDGVIWCAVPGGHWKCRGRFVKCVTV